MSTNSANWNSIEIIELPSTQRATDLYRAICEYAGTPMPADQTGPGECIVREGYEASYATARALRAALGDDNAPVFAFPRTINGVQVGTTWAAYDTQRLGRAAVRSQGETPGISPAQAIAAAIAQEKETV